MPPCRSRSTCQPSWAATFAIQALASRSDMPSASAGTGFSTTASQPGWSHQIPTMRSSSSLVLLRFLDDRQTVCWLHVWGTPAVGLPMRDLAAHVFGALGGAHVGGQLIEPPLLLG